LAALKADTDIFTTFEGDNTVLMQLVAKARLAALRRQFRGMKLPGLMRYGATQAFMAVTQRNPFITRRTSETHLRSSRFQMLAFEYREQTLLLAAAKRLKKALAAGEDAYTAFLHNQNLMVELAHAHMERVILQAFIDGIDRTDDPALVDILNKLRALFALSLIDRYKGWYLEHGYLTPAKSRATARQVEKLSYEVSREAVALVDAFAIPEQCLAAPIAQP
jgi:acyl-CoA oxidase